MVKLTAKELLELVKLLRIDVFFMLTIFALYIPSVTVTQLSQDKYCMNTYSVNESICLELETHTNDSYTPIRNMVLEDATTLKMYSTIIVTVPGIVFSLFLGYWVDTYPGHIRYMLTLGPICGILQNLITIYQCFAFDISMTLNYFTTFYSSFAPIWILFDFDKTISQSYIFDNLGRKKYEATGCNTLQSQKVDF
uniref:Uncharacterized protein n=1 Tax=Tetranychus urticae TaxID=32264 RepID=T1JZL4_TETUR